MRNEYFFKEENLNIISIVLVLSFIILLIPMHLFPCFIAGFLTYELIMYLTPYFEKIVGVIYARWLAIILIIFSIFTSVILMITCAISFLKSDIRNSFDILAKASSILSDVKNYIPKYIPAFLPESAEDLKNQIVKLIESNLIIIRNMGHSFLHRLITILIGLIIGTIISLNKSHHVSTNFTKQIVKRLKHLSYAFKSIVLAQVKISLINTILTSIMIFILLPMAGIHLPLEKTLITVTFIFGLLPIVGNLASNFIIIISALSVSLFIGLIMMFYLIFIHKLEYFLNAEIIGNRVNAKSWELLLAMLMFESLFGVEGLIAAPIYYSYLKIELKECKLI